jgi:hypothetical protein
MGNMVSYEPSLSRDEIQTFHTPPIARRSYSTSPVAQSRPMLNVPSLTGYFGQSNQLDLSRSCSVSEAAYPN